MRITGLSRAAGLTLFAILALAAESTPLASIAKIATALSEGDSDGALEYFDSHMAGYPDIQQKLEAIAEQADVSCAIDIVADEAVGDAHKLDLDWYMEMKAQSGSGALERRRERVQVEMKAFKGVWKITSLAPVSIFNPLPIR